jgi:hypothetical protein
MGTVDRCQFYIRLAHNDFQILPALYLTRRQCSVGSKSRCTSELIQRAFEKVLQEIQWLKEPSIFERKRSGTRLKEWESGNIYPAVPVAG